MSPLPSRDRLGEYALKGIHLGLRQIGSAPEQIRARHLQEQARARGLLANDAGSRVDGGKRVLFLTPRDWASHVQWESMIAQGLRLRGADVVFATCGGGLELCDRVNTYEGPPVPCRSCARYVRTSVRSHGFPLVELRDAWAAEDPGDWPELDGMSLNELLNVEHDGFPLGRLMSIPLRWFLVRSVVDDDPLAPMTARRFLRSARRVLAGLQVVLDDARPDTVVLLNGLFFFESIAWELCRRRGIDVVAYERGFIIDTLLFRRGDGDILDVSSLWTAWRDVPLAAEEEKELDSYLQDRMVGRRTMDRYWTDAKFDGSADAKREGRLVTLFTNLTWDSAVLGQELAFPGIHDWLVAAVEAFVRRPRDELVIRIHPAESKLAGKQTREPLAEFVRGRFQPLPANVRVIEAGDPTSSYPLMAASDLGLVFTSTTGLELALHQTPVIVAGRTHYRDKGFTLDASSPEDFDRLLEKALEDPNAVAPDLTLARRYAYLFFFRVPVQAPGVVEHVPGLARITTTELGDLAPGVDADIDRLCDAILGGGGFLEPPGGPEPCRRRH